MCGAWCCNCLTVYFQIQNVRFTVVSFHFFENIRQINKKRVRNNECIHVTVILYLQSSCVYHILICTYYFGNFTENDDVMQRPYEKN